MLPDKGNLALEFFYEIVKQPMTSFDYGLEQGILYEI